MYLLLLGSILAAALNGVVLKKYGAMTSETVFGFNLICSLVWFLLLLAVNGFHVHSSFVTVGFGILYGITQALFVLFKTLAIGSGPVSVTTLIGNSSVILTVIVCFLIWGEAVSPIDIPGLLLLSFAIILCVKQESAEKSTLKWRLYAAVFFVLASAVGITFKAFSKTSGSKRSADMLIVASLVMLSIYTLISILLQHKAKSPSYSDEKKQLKTFLISAVGCGALSCIYNRLNIYLTGILPAVVFFPAFNGGVILLSTVLSRAFCKENISKRQAVGILLGITAICIIGIF